MIPESELPDPDYVGERIERWQDEADSRLIRATPTTEQECKSCPHNTRGNNFCVWPGDAWRPEDCPKRRKETQ